MFQLPYQALRQRLLELDGIPEVFWFHAQTDENDEPIFHVPAVYLEFEPVDTVDYQADTQQGEVVFNVRLYTEEYAQEDQLLEHFALARAIYAKLHHWTANLSYLPAFADRAGTDQDRVLLNLISRKNIAPDHNGSNTLTTLQRFSCRVVDIDAWLPLTPFNATLEVQRP